MKWWKSLEPIYKAVLAFLGAITFGMAVAGALIGTQTARTGDALQEEIETNATAHEGIYRRLSDVEESVDDIGSDLSLVRCWARHEIQGTDPAECLVLGRGGGADNNGGGP
jgi:hypothetical protein